MDSNYATSILSADDIQEKNTLKNANAACLCDPNVFAVLSYVVNRRKDCDSVFTLAARLAVGILFNPAISQERGDQAARASVAFLAIHENAIVTNRANRKALIGDIIRCFHPYANEKKLLEAVLSTMLARFAGGPLTFTVSFIKKGSTAVPDITWPPLVLETEIEPSESEPQEEITQKCCELEQHLLQVMTLMENLHGSPTEDHNQNQLTEQGIWQEKGLSLIYYDIKYLRDQLIEMRELSKALKEDPDILKILYSTE